MPPNAMRQREGWLLEADATLLARPDLMVDPVAWMDRHVVFHRTDQSASLLEAKASPNA